MKKNGVPQSAFPQVCIKLPFWMESFLAESPKVFPTDAEKMRFTIGLSRKNIEHNTGGPFGAAVFGMDGRLVAPGVNMVIPSNCSILHAEMVAIAFSQKKVGRFDLSNGGAVALDLFASTEPCAMCFGAVPWSGVSRLVCGARDSDARKVGFDEGPKPSSWVKALKDRHIRVVRNLMRKEAAAVLIDYAVSGGVIYNSGKQAYDSIR